MFSCENISFVLRTHHCSFALQTLRGLRSMFTKVNISFMYYVHSPWLTNQKIKENRSLSLVEMHQQSTRFQEVRMNHQKEASFSLGSYRGYSLYIYVYIHFQYFPAEKLIVHVNGYSFRLSTKVCKENHSSQKREYPLTFTNFEPKLHFNAGSACK